MTSGWIPAWRKLFDADHWLAPTHRHPAGRREAWLDLCQMATWKDRETASSGVLQRGEIVVSFRTLAKRWKWSKDSAQRFMSGLQTATAIATVRETPDGTVYRIVNYETYAVDGNGDRDTDRDSERDRGETAARQEVEGKKGKQQKYTSDFEELWAVDGRGSKKVSFARYQKAVPSKVTHDVLLKARVRHVREAREPRFVKHLERWIQDERWIEGVGTNGNGSTPGFLRPAPRAP